MRTGGRAVVWVMGALCIVAMAVVCFGPVTGRREAVAGAWSRLRDRRRPVPSNPPVEQIVADLRRLARNLEQVETSNEPAKMARLRAASLAYDEVLLAACRTLQVPAPRVPPLETVERLETEAALAQRGLDW